MKHAVRFLPAFALIGLFGCQPRATQDEKKPWPFGDETSHSEVPATQMTPPWRDLKRHTHITTGRATHPSASKDGRWFVYASTETGPTPQIMRRETDGNVPTQLTTNNHENLFPRFSPDGGRVAFASNVGGNWDIYVISVAAPAAWQQVTDSPNDDIAPSWSPDGKQLVYCTKTLAGFWQIVIVDVATGIPTYLGAGMYPDWSPDGEWIAFQSQPRGGQKSAIWIVRKDGSDLRELAADRHRQWSAMNPRWSVDGQWIAYSTVLRSPESRKYGAMDEADDIWVITPEGKYDTRLTDDLSPEWWPAWGGDRLFFVSKHEGTQDIYSVRPLPLAEPRGE